MLGSLEEETQLEARKTIPSDPNLPVRGKDPHASINSCITLFPRLTIVFGRYLSVGTGIEPQALFPSHRESAKRVSKSIKQLPCAPVQEAADWVVVGGW